MKNRHFVVRTYKEDFIPNVLGVFFLGWNHGRGTTPRQSVLAEDQLDRTLRFNLSGEYRRKRLNYYKCVGLTAEDYQKADHAMVKAFLVAMPRALRERGLPGSHFVAGSVSRASKKKWESYLTEAIYRPDDFLMAKLMGIRELEEEVWSAAGYPAIQY